MSKFIIRNQGFFYTDEYYAPGEVFKQVVRTTFATKAAADQACAALVRKWVRAETLDNYVFNDRKRSDAILKYMRAQWPDDINASSTSLYDIAIPDDATDAQIDEIVRLMDVTFAQVFEVEDGAKAKSDDEDEDEDEDDDADDDEDEDAGFEDELHYGPTR